LGGDEEAAGVVLNEGDEKKDQTEREYAGSAENDECKREH
jgi:hypothetical protein